ncbi:MAG: universal stress protein [Nitrospinota bacterium]
MFGHILVPLDGSPLAEAILPLVEELAKVHGARVTLLRVAYAHPIPGVDPTDSQVRVIREAETYLGEQQRALGAKGVETSVSVRYGFPPEEIVAHAAEREVDLIAMSTHGRSGPKRWILGSVAEQVLRRAPVAVLLARAPSEPAH